ncbi:carboxymuconolactone decarboxylase family protein [Novosphingobium sp. KCTC 2891]|uniref:carboxymuconolactone decarboxylase family protein n=1 Tax=Novosphingobium sp. KCTC 2891 TaxID=2989730 RepID=UPI0022227158|nr:carboxymuconolactone decarboxylase family protein [Novosphingobium sp. KCTC 2891]MCW1384198.1 carboxymuconolactone decarboxylase family protein [Novosphingobium sp. KCTC 2891]
MVHDWQEMARNLSGAIKQVRQGTPDVMKAFSQMAQSATVDGALDARTKELIALGIAVAIRCDGCVAFHAQAAVKHGATREEVMETMGMALYMGAGPSLMYAAQAVEAYDQFAAAAVTPTETA